MNGIEDQVEERKDHSRPFFPRKSGEVGLYVDVDEVTCMDPHAYGSEHLMRVEMNDMLGEQLVKRDLVKVKGELDRQGHFQGAILEGFRKGTILAVIFDTVEALQGLWKLYQGKQLSSLFQALFVDKTMLEALGVRKLSLRVRMWPDELEACQQEMEKMAKEKKLVNINSRPRDVGLLHQVEKYQKEESRRLLEQLQDAVSRFEMKLSDFLLYLKQALPQGTKLSTLKEFHTNVTVAMGIKSKGTEHVKHYFSTLELLRTWLAQAEVNLYLPLLLIPERCETEKQRQLKMKMRSKCQEMQRLLKPTTPITKEAYYKGWENKVLSAERMLFMGVISLVPLGLQKVTDMDQFLDEYINSFPSDTATKMMWPPANDLRLGYTNCVFIVISVSYFYCWLYLFVFFVIGTIV